MSDIINIIALQNPWQRTGQLSVPGFLEREILAKIEKLEKRPEIITLLGPRQAGKTTLFYKLINQLLEKKTPPESIYYFNLDNLKLRHFLKDPADLLSFLSSKKIPFFYLFFDEAQRLKDAGIFLKQIKDSLAIKAKIYVSGSSSLLLRAKTKEYLTGRQIKFTLLPFSFSEFLKISKIDLPTEGGKSFLKNFFRLYGEALTNQMNLFLNFGGYPQIVNTSDLEEKKILLENLVGDYLEKDISDFLQLDPVIFNKVLSLLAYKVGNIVNFQELSRSSEVSLPTVNKYLKILEETFVIRLIKPFFQNKRKEISHNPKVYFYDPGLRNRLISNFNLPSQRGDCGALVENFVLLELMKSESNYRINFWRTQAGAEVDFVLQKGKEVVSLEVKYQEMKIPAVSKSYANFINNYRPKKGWILTKDYFGERMLGGCEIRYLPAVFINNII